jgi:hypothetical protein
MGLELIFPKFFGAKLATDGNKFTALLMLGYYLFEVFKPTALRSPLASVHLVVTLLFMFSHFIVLADILAPMA